MSNTYRAIAKRFGIKYRIGKYGVQFMSRWPDGSLYKLINIVPLDGWVTDPKVVERIMRERGLEL